jgi:Spy/CpxP family protein refolding chaperone
MIRPAVWKMLLYSAALFIAGAVCGAMLMSRLAPAEQQPLKLGRTGEIAAKLRTRLDTKLQLTAAQQQQFDPLIEKTSGQLESIHKDCLDRISAALDELHVQMGPGLTPEQHQLLTGLEAERRQALWQNYNYPPATTNSTAR